VTVDAPDLKRQTETQATIVEADAKRWQRLAHDTVLHRKLLFWAWGLLGVAVALWLTRGVWGDRPPAGDDVMGHLVRNQWGLDEVVFRGDLDGWFPRFMAGHQTFLLYGPGFSWMLAGLRVMSFGMLSTVGAFKTLTLLSILVLPAAVAFLARSFGLSWRAAWLAGILALAVNSPFGVGLKATYVIGLVPHQVAVPAFCLALGAIVRTALDDRRRWQVLAVIGVSVVVLTHPISILMLTFFTAVTVFVMSISGQLTWAALRRLILSAVLAFGVCGFWLLPYLAHRDLRGPVASWTTPPLGDRLNEISSGQILFPAPLGWLVLAGVVWIGYQSVRRKDLLLALALMPIALLVVGHGLPQWWPGEISLLLANRGLGYAGLIAVIPLAVFLSKITRKDVLGNVALSVLVVILVVIPGRPDQDAKQMPEVVPAMEQAADELGRLVPAGARFAVERDFPGEIGRTGVTQPNLWLAYWSGKNELNVFNGESSASAGVGYVPDDIGQEPPGPLADELSALGVTHVVTVSEETPATLSDSGRYSQVWASGPLAIFDVEPPTGQPDAASLTSVESGSATAELVSSDPERLRIAIDASEATTATVAVAWSPGWHVSVDGEDQEILRTEEHNLIAVEVPAGSSDIALDYRSGAWDNLGLLLSILTLAGCAVLFRRSRIVRSSPDEVDGSPPGLVVDPSDVLAKDAKGDELDSAEEENGDEDGRLPTETLDASQASDNDGRNRYDAETGGDETGDGGEAKRMDREAAYRGDGEQ
jgi:hypothetical protein